MDNAALLVELPRLRRYARALLGDRAAADDLVQYTLERAWEQQRQRRGGGELRPWLLRILHQLRGEQLRRAGPPAHAVGGDENAPPERRELLDLDAALARLPEEQRAVLLLVSLEDMRYEDVAESLGLAPGSVLSCLSRAREHLRLLLDVQPMPPPLRVLR